jgi:hypothetical protein
MIRRACLILALSAAPVAAHEWYTGQQNELGYSCCGGQDCNAIRDDQVRQVGPSSWEITLWPGDLPSVTVENIGPDPKVFRFDGNPGLSPDGFAAHLRPEISRLGGEGSMPIRRRSVLTALALFIAMPAFAQDPCGDRAEIIAKLAESYDETASATALNSARTGTWTILATGPNGPTCIVSMGEMWTFVPQGAPL